MDENSILEAARNAWHAGLCPIRAAVDGSKRPLGEWKKYQTDRPEQMDIESWFREWPNLGLVCGQVSDRLECLEFEGSFLLRVGLNRVLERMRTAGLFEVFEAWVDGYSEVTPGGGLHILVHLEGDGRLPGNTKIAMSTANETWIETRGEGGFVVIAPSNGATHPTGRPWKLYSGGFEQITYTTLELWDAVLGVLGSFDESPAHPSPPPPPARPFTGNGWVGEALAAFPDLTDVLASHGWVYVRSDSLGQLWRRPGKSFGHSGRLNLSGRLQVFSSSTPLPIGRTTFDALDVDLAYKLGRAPTRDERVAALRPAARVGPMPRAEATEPTPSTLNLPDDFWQQRPWLTHVLVAAQSRGLSPDAVLEGVIWGFAAHIWPQFLLPDDGTFDFIGVNVGESGAGKTQAKSAAMKLLGSTVPEVWVGAPPGSGEGIAESYIRRGAKGHQDGLAFRGIGWYADEGVFIQNLHKRAGNTTVEILKSAWSGELTGQRNARNESTRILAPRQVRTAMLISITPADAARFLAADYAEGGFAQRISWAWAHHPGILKRLDRPEWPGLLDLPLHLNESMGRVLEVDRNVIATMDEIDLERKRSAETGGSPLDAHAMYGTLKLAGIFALMDDRFHVTMQDWALASQKMDNGRQVRAHVALQLTAATEARHIAAGRGDVVREDARVQYRMQKGLMQLIGLLERNDGCLTAKAVKDQLRALKKRYGIRHTEVIDEAVIRGLCTYSPRDGVRLRAR